MTHTKRSLIIAAVVAMAGVSTADASSNLQVYSWWLNGGAARVNVTGGDYNNVGYGPLRGRLDGNEVTSPLYCLDLFHSFSFGQNWDVDTYIIPPDIPPAPPWNVEEAAWIYNRYGFTTDVTEARGVQIALWEVTHEGDANSDGTGDWLDRYVSSSLAGGWQTQGDFKYTSGDSYASSLSHADGILSSLRSAVIDRNNGQGWDQGGTVTYYRPTDSSAPGQGQMGRTPIPEPTTLLILGASFAAIGAQRFRRRKVS